MDREVLPWGCYDGYPKEFRIRRGRVVAIPEQWQGRVPQWPGTLERRQKKKAAKRMKRRSAKLRSRQEASKQYEEMKDESD